MTMTNDSNTTKLQEIGRGAYHEIATMVDALRVDYDRLDELRDMRTPWAVGYNMPGFMPDNDPSYFTTYDEAREYLIDELTRAADEAEDDANALPYTNAIYHVKATETGAEYGQTIGAYHWWLSRADNDGMDESDFDDLTDLEDAAGDCESEDDARTRIKKDALFVEVRSGWVTQGEELTAFEFNILITTGGPAVRIRGELNEHNEPHRAWLEVQDWYLPWTEYVGADQGVLLDYARCFYFGE